MYSILVGDMKMQQLLTSITSPPIWGHTLVMFRNYSQIN